MASLDRDAVREEHADEYPEITAMSAFQFTTCFKFVKEKLDRGDKPRNVIVMVLPALGGKKGSLRYSQRCRNKLVAHRSWISRLSDA